MRLSLASSLSLRINLLVIRPASSSRKLTRLFEKAGELVRSVWRSFDSIPLGLLVPMRLRNNDGIVQRDLYLPSVDLDELNFTLATGSKYR